MKTQLEKLRLVFGCSMWLALWLAANYGLLAALNLFLVIGKV